MDVAANILIIILEIFGLRISIGSRRWKIFAYYTQLSNLTAFFSCIAYLVFRERAADVRYLAVCMLTMTFLITLFVLVPMGGGLKKLMFSGNGLYHHTLCPILSFLSYVFLEPHAASWYVPVAVTFLYGVVMLTLNGLRRYDGPYPFFRVYRQSRAATVLWMTGLTAFISVLSLGVIFLGNI